MTTEIGFIQPESTGVSLDDASNALISQPRVTNPAPLCHRSKQWTLRDGGGLQPIFYGLHRAVHRASHDSNDLPLPFLIGLASADHHTHSFVSFLEVRNIQGNEL